MMNIPFASVTIPLTPFTYKGKPFIAWERLSPGEERLLRLNYQAWQALYGFRPEDVYANWREEQTHIEDS